MTLKPHLWTNVVSPFANSQQSRGGAHPYPNIASLVALQPKEYSVLPLYSIPPSINSFDTEDYAAHTRLIQKAVINGEINVLKALLLPAAPFLKEEFNLVDNTASSSVSGFDDVDAGPSRSAAINLVNSVDSNGLSLLHHAMRVQPAPNLEIVELLWFSGADSNLACAMKSTPLHHLSVPEITVFCGKLRCLLCRFPRATLTEPV